MSIGEDMGEHHRKVSIDGKYHERLSNAKISDGYRWQYAQENDVQLPDEYDQIVRFISFPYTEAS